MTENQIALIQADIRALRELEGSRGWAIVTEVLKEDVVLACYAMADGVLMTEKEVDFRRGAISAARNVLNILPALIARRENELLLASAEADALTRPATA